MCQPVFVFLAVDLVTPWTMCRDFVLVQKGEAYIIGAAPNGLIESLRIAIRFDSV
jgi:hypothetical protein